MSIFALALGNLSALVGAHIKSKPPTRNRKSLFIRHLDGGSSNSTELELIALANPYYDVNKYGIRFVSSPRHADVLLITGPLTRSMLGPAQATFDAMPEPKKIITVGDYADFKREDNDPSNLFAQSYAIADLPKEMKDSVVDHVPGNPPNPEAIIKVLLKWKAY